MGFMKEKPWVRDEYVLNPLVHLVGTLPQLGRL